MPVRLLALLSLLVLAGCQTNRALQDYDSSRDFPAYRSWNWQEPAVQYRPNDPRIQSDLMDQRIRQAVSSQLDQRGLRPAQGPAPGDLKVQAYYIVENRQQQITTNYGGGWGGYWGGPWVSPAYFETRNVDYRVATVQVDMFDGHDGKLVWRGSSEYTLGNGTLTPSQHSDNVYKAVAKVLANYPPP